MGTTFKPFERVLVRNEDSEPWRPGHFSHRFDDGTFRCIARATTYKQCIPYSGNEALCWQIAPYEEPESYKFGENVIVKFYAGGLNLKAVFIGLDKNSTDKYLVVIEGREAVQAVPYCRRAKEGE